MTTWTQIGSLSAPTGGLFEFTGLSLSAYSAIELICAGLTVSADDAEVRLRLSVGSSFITTGYRFSILGVSSSPAMYGDGTPTGIGINLLSDSATIGVGNAAGETFNSIVHIDEPSSTAHYKKAAFESFWATPSGNRHAGNGMGIMENTGAIDGIRIYLDTGNLNAGNVRLVGLA